MDCLGQIFTLTVRFRDKVFTLNYPGDKTIQEVKGDVYSLIDVPIRNQVWTGWPVQARDDTMTLADSGIGYPCHDLHVHIAETSRRTMETKPVQVVDSDDEFEDAADSFQMEDMFGDEEDSSSIHKPQALMPDHVTDEKEAMENFCKEFENRYGDFHPEFFLGPLEDALKDSLHLKAKERRLLAIYLHHDKSILSNVFCSQILCSDSVVTYLSSNYILWAWDMTSEANKARLLTQCTQHFGSVAANTIRTFKPDELPLLLIISRNRSTNEVVNVIKGSTMLDELMTQLIQAVEVFQDQLQDEMVEEAERDARERMMREQDEAYQESLMADKLKAEQKKVLQEEQMKVEQAEQAKVHEQIRLRIQEEEEKLAVSRSLADQLPDEPPLNCSEPVSALRIRCPDGNLLQRRFLAQSPMQIVLNYITSEGYHVTDYKVLTTYPRKDLTSVDTSQSLKGLNLFPQETLILEEK